jgi:hypothetical protein
MTNEGKEKLQTAKAELSRMMAAGATAETVARYVASLPAIPGVALSHTIEESAYPGTFAAAVFNLLCDGVL